MPNRIYALNSQPDQKNLEISWTGGEWHVQRDITVRFEGTVLRVFAQREELSQPQEVSIPGHPPISIYLKDGSFDVRQQGTRLSDIESHPKAVISEVTSLFFGWSLILLISSLVPLILLPFPQASKSIPFQSVIHLPVTFLSLFALLASRAGGFPSAWRFWGIILALFTSWILISIVHPITAGERISISTIFTTAFFIWISIRVVIAWQAYSIDQVPGSKTPAQ